MANTTKTTLTPEEKARYLRFVEETARAAAEAALEGAAFDADRLRRLTEYDEELGYAFHDEIERISVRDRFNGQESSSDRRYGHGYRPLPIDTQVRNLRECFPGLETADFKVAEGKLPEGAEAWFAIPRPERLAPTYGEALVRVFEKLERQRPAQLREARKRGFGPTQLRRHPHPHLAACRKRQDDAQAGKDILIVPAQFGLRHRGRSVRRARELMAYGQAVPGHLEYALGAFDIAVMLLLHPERIVDARELQLLAAGDDRNAGILGRDRLTAEVGFSSVNLKLEFGAPGHYDAGVPSAFVAV